MSTDSFVVGGFGVKESEGKLSADAAELRIVSGDQLNQPVIKLWSAQGRAPRVPNVACSPNGNLIAVAGGPENDIKLFLANDLVAGNDKLHQQLFLNSIRYDRIKFASNGDARGFFLTEASGSKSIYSFNEKTIVDAAGWNIDSSDTSVDTLGPAKSRIRLEQGSTLTSAVVSSVPNNGVRLVAVASQRRGQPKLQIHDGATGKTDTRIYRTYTTYPFAFVFQRRQILGFLRERSSRLRLGSARY